MRLLAALALVMVNSSYAGDNAVVGVPLDEVWRRANQALYSHDLAVTTTNKDAGVIEAIGSTPTVPGWLNCPMPARGRHHHVEFRVQVLVNSIDADRTGVQVHVSGDEIWYRGGKVSSRVVFSASPCESTGSLEQFVLDLITGNQPSN